RGKAMTQKKIKIGIIGASGYTGVELVRLLLCHPAAEIALLVGNSKAGQRMSELYPHLEGFSLSPMVSSEAAEWDGIDIAFCCLPHGTSQEVIAQLPQHLRIIDLSADFRLRDVGTYATWYGHEHQALELQKK